VRRRAGRWLTLSLLAALLLVGCGGAASPTTPQASVAPSASIAVLGEAELAVCDGTIRMGQGVTMLRETRLRRGAANRLTSGLDTVVEGQRLVLEYATARMRTRVRTLGFAVTNMTIAVEDYQTTDRLDAAASNIKRRTTALRRAVDSFRSWVGCPPPVADDAAPATTDPAATSKPEASPAA
jgi:hypothetical protein